MLKIYVIYKNMMKIISVIKWAKNKKILLYVHKI